MQTETPPDNLYAPPVAQVADLASSEQRNEFYVVATYKFFLLFFMTLGIYSLYWFYKHWANYRANHQESLWPIPRAIFAIFFTHSLFGKFDESLVKSGVTHRWSASSNAMWYVILLIITSGLDRLAARSIGSPLTDIASIVLLLPMAMPLHAGQQAANAACGDPKGTRNAHLTVANYIWLVIGFLLWALILVGLFLPAEDLA